MSQAKRENKHFLASVDKGKAIQAIVQRKKKQGVEVRERESQRAWHTNLLSTALSAN